MSETIYSIEEIGEKLYSAVVSDVLDHLGYRHQSPHIPFTPFTGSCKMVGRCKTTLWVDMHHEDPAPYALELAAVDSCKPGDILIAAASGSERSGIWGELLSTAARNQGCVGALVWGCVRDIAPMRKMGFPVFATGRSVYDSLNRQRVVDIDVPVDLAGVTARSNELIICDEDGVVIVPREVEDQAIKHAFDKVAAENRTREAIKKGMKATDAYNRYGVL